jgi:energy-coupling factor transport system permease protein
MLLGQYSARDSFLHRLDTRAKLVPVVLVMVLGLLTGSVWFYLIVLAGLMIGLMTSGVEPAALARSFRPILILVAITALYHILFTGRDSEPVFSLFGFAVTEAGLAGAGFYSLRLLLFVSIVFLVTLTSAPSDLAEAVVRTLRPLEKVRVPVNDLGLILFIAIRFIPILQQEFIAIRNAQVIRGVDFAGSFFKRIRSSTAIIVPVLVAAISRADDLALAMEARGYQSERRRTLYSRLVFGPPAWLFTILSTGVLLLTFWLTRT